MQARGRIYAIKFLGEIIYVGQTGYTVDSRLWHHLSVARTSKKPHTSIPKLHQHMREHNFQGYTVESLEYVTDDSKRDERETFWIAHLNTRSKCNSSPGGHPGHKNPQLRGKPLTAEHAAKIREGQRRTRLQRRDLRPVRSKETGKSWPSITDCANEFGVSTGAILYRIKNTVQTSIVKELGTQTFEYVPKDGPTV